MKDYSLKKKIKFGFVLLSISFFLSIILIELLLHIFFIKYDPPAIIKETSLQYEPSLFSRHILPRKTQKVKIDYEKAAVTVDAEINGKGYRGRDFNSVKPDGTIRIMIYGGSQVFDMFNPEEKDWPHQVEQILRKNGFADIEVINAGIPGHASFDSVGRLFTEGHIFRPDYVIIDNAWNDIKLFRHSEPLLRVMKPLSIQDDPRISYQGSVDRILCEHSQIYLRLRSRYINRKYNIDIEGAVPEDKNSDTLNETALKQYRLDMEMFVDLARNIGAVPILMTQPRLVLLNNNEDEIKFNEHLSHKMSSHTISAAFEKTDEIIRSVAASKNAFMIDASRDLTGKREFFADRVHTTDKGSYNLALITAGHLMKLLNERNVKTHLQAE